MKKLLITLIIISLLFILSTCFFTGNTSVSVSPVIRALGLPTDITSVELTVSGPGMNTIGVVYDGLPSSIDLTVPSGSDRKFVLDVYGTIPFSAATSYQGITTIDLDSGADTITLEMYAYESKLLAVNSYIGVNFARIVQLDDMTGTGWEEIVQGDLALWTGSFSPRDIDIDGNGTIIVANNSTIAATPILYRLTNIFATTFEPLALSSGAGGGGIAVAVDRQNEVIYYATTTQLIRCDYLGSSIKNNFDMAGITIIRGIAVDDEGMLYIAHDNQVQKYNPNIGNGVTSTIYSTGLLNPQDISVKSSFIFVTDVDTISTNHKIVKLDLNLNYIDELPNSGSFPMWGPRRFVGKRNRKIYFADDQDIFNNDKLVTIDDINGNGWNTYGSHGFTTGLFSFAYGC